MYSNQPQFGDFSVFFSELLGQGTYAKVYGAKKISTDEVICVKIIKVTPENEKIIEREIQILKKLKNCDHPNLIKIFDIFNQNNLLYIFMEKCQQNLGEFIKIHKQKKQLLSLNEIIDITKQIVDGYHDLYSNHIIHRDLKPENLLIGKDNKIKICDFGFGKIVNFDNLLIVQSILGTPLYISPQALMTGLYTSKTDVYSFGLILYFLIFQESYYKAKTLDQLIQKIMVLDKEFSIGEIKNVGSQENLTLLQYILHGCIKFNEKDRFNWEQLFNIFDQISVPQNKLKPRSQSRKIADLRQNSQNKQTNACQEEQFQVIPQNKLSTQTKNIFQKPPLKQTIDNGGRTQLKALKNDQLFGKGIGRQSVAQDNNYSTIERKSPQQNNQTFCQASKTTKNNLQNYFSIKNETKKYQRAQSIEKKLECNINVFESQSQYNKKRLRQSKSEKDLQQKQDNNLVDKKLIQQNDQQICKTEQNDLDDNQNQTSEQKIKPFFRKLIKRTDTNNYFKLRTIANTEQNNNNQDNTIEIKFKQRDKVLQKEYENKINVLKLILNGILAKIQLGENLIHSQRNLSQILDFRQDIFRYLIINYQQSILLNLISIKNNQINRQQYPLQNELLEFIEPINYFLDEEFNQQINHIKETFLKLNLKNQLALQQLNEILSNKKIYNVEDLFELIQTDNIKYNFKKILECYENHYYKFLEQQNFEYDQIKQKDLQKFLGYSLKFVQFESLYTIEKLRSINVDEISYQEEDCQILVKLIKEYCKKN